MSPVCFVTEVLSTLRGSAPIARHKGLPQSSALRLCRPALRFALSAPASPPGVWQRFETNGPFGALTHAMSPRTSLTGIYFQCITLQPELRSNGPLPAKKESDTAHNEPLTAIWPSLSRIVAIPLFAQGSPSCLATVRSGAFSAQARSAPRPSRAQI